MIAGNPEQAVLAVLCLFILSWTQTFSDLKIKSKQALLICVIGYLITQIWMLYYGVTNNRITVLPFFLKMSIENFFTAPLFLIWHWFGVGSIMVFTTILISRRIDRTRLLPSLVLIPAAATLMTADGPRVFGNVVMPTMIVVGAKFWNQFADSHRELNIARGGFLLAWIAIPTSTNWGYLGSRIIFSFNSALIPLTEWFSKLANFA